MTKKIIAIGIAILFVLMVFPMVTLSAADYTPADGDTVDISGYVSGDNVLIPDGYSVTVTGTNTNIEIRCAGNVTLTIDDLTISNAGLTRTPISFSGTGNTLMLDGVSSLVGGSACPGIRVQGSAALTINSTTGGSVTATGGLTAAGIGGGQMANGGTITISGGTVTATGGMQASGIGGGHTGVGGAITISGGSVTARGGSLASGIGGGYFGSGGDITISGGTVNATAGQNGAGIGGGHNGVGGTITISGGTVTANGGDLGAGVGGGCLRDGGTITISGGSINAKCGLSYGAGIGGGYDGDGGTIAISGGSINATGGTYGAGLGGGYDGDGGTVAISGGNINATGGQYGAGIGGGSYKSGGEIAISGGQVFAAAGTGAQDIGRGDSGATTGSLTLSGAAVVFLRTDNSLTPVTTTHEHEVITALDGGAVYGITVPTGWTPNFGAYLYFNTLSFDNNGGAGVITDITGLCQTSVLLPDEDALSRTYYFLTGWNTSSDGSGTAALPGDAYTLNGTETLFAQWTADPLLSASTASPIVAGESITLTPNIPGGTWEYDSTALDRDGNVFTGLVAGAYLITYTVDGQSVSFDLDVTAAPTPTPVPTAVPTSVPTASPTNTPGTGAQDVVRTGEVQSILPTILTIVGVCLLMVSGGSFFEKRAKRKENK